MTGNDYANSGVSADNRSTESYEHVYVNEDVPNTQVTRSDKETLTSGINTTWSRCYKVTIVCVVLLSVLLISAIIVLWIKLSMEKNLSKQLQQEKNELRKLSNRLQRERDELRNLNTQLQEERDEPENSDMQDKQKWTNFGSSLYYFSEMKDLGIDRGGDLVIIDSQEKQEFIVEQLLGGRAWIGLTDDETEGKWTWVDGTPLTTGYWTKNQTDNGNNKDCAEIGYTNEGAWNDKPCFYRQGWICEKKAESVELK